MMDTNLEDLAEKIALLEKRPWTEFEKKTCAELAKLPTITQRLDYWLNQVVQRLSKEDFLTYFPYPHRLFGFFSMPSRISNEHIAEFENAKEHSLEFSNWFLRHYPKWYAENILIKKWKSDWCRKVELQKIEDFENEARQLFRTYEIGEDFSFHYAPGKEMYGQYALFLKIQSGYYDTHSVEMPYAIGCPEVEMIARHTYYKAFLKAETEKKPAGTPDPKPVREPKNFVWLCFNNASRATAIKQKIQTVWFPNESLTWQTITPRKLRAFIRALQDEPLQLFRVSTPGAALQRIFVSTFGCQTRKDEYQPTALREEVSKDDITEIQRLFKDVR